MKSGVSLLKSLTEEYFGVTANDVFYNTKEPLHYTTHFPHMQ